MFIFINFIVFFILPAILVLIVDNIPSDTVNPLGFLLIGIFSLVVLGSVVENHKAEIEAFFDCHTATTESVYSAPVPNNTVPEKAVPVTKPTASPYEIQLHNGKVYLVQNGQTKQLPISKTGNTTIVLKP